MNEPLHISQRDAVTELTLNRPAHRNALSADLIAALRAALHAARADAAVRVVVLTGAPPAFCAGLDLQEVAQAATSATAYDTSALQALYETIETLPQPVVAAANGAATAGGATLLCACDLVVAAADARLGYPGIRHGLVAPIVMPSLTRLVGERRARYLLLTGELISAADAVAWGLANEVVPADRLLPRVRELAATLVALPAEALAQTKTLFRRLRQLEHSSAAAAEIRRLASSVPLTTDVQARLARYQDV